MSYADFQAESEDHIAAPRAPRANRGDKNADLSPTLQEALRGGLESLFREQKTDGFWVGELEADASLEADAILLDYYLGNPDQQRVQKLARTIREEQASDGGWSLYPGGAPNINVTIKA